MARAKKKTSKKNKIKGIRRRRSRGISTDGGSASIDAVLNKLFYSRTQVNDDLARLDLMDLEQTSVADETA